MIIEFMVISRLLLSIDRRNSVEEARDTVELAHQYSKFDCHHVKVVGIDLSGDPSVSMYECIECVVWYCDKTDVTILEVVKFVSVENICRKKCIGENFLPANFCV